MKVYSPFAVALGAWTAVRSARWVDHGPRLAELMRAPGPRPERAVPRGATGGAVLALRLLQKLPGGRWRNTCLYRSVAECLILRRHGVPAVLMIGARRGDGDIEAHAWVVRADRPERAVGPSDGGHQPLVLRA